MSSQVKSSQVKSSQVKSSQVKSKILAAVLGLGLISSAAQAQITTTETLNFDNNQLPGGWNVWLQTGSPGTNVTFQNQRLEVGQVDTYGGIYKSLDTSNLSQVKVEYDANIANVTWGQSTAALLAKDPTNRPAGSAISVMGAHPDAMQFFVFQELPSVPWTGYAYENVMTPVFGNYHMSAVFQNGQISQTVTNLDTGATFASGLVTLPGFLLSDMHNVILYGATTTGTSAWIDNATISITTAVPEPETYAMLLAGLGVLGAVSRRKQKQTTAA
jgi:hypothetical protein